MFQIHLRSKRLLLLVLIALCALVVAFAFAPGIEIGALRNIVLYRIETAWHGSTPAPEGALTSQLRGRVFNAEGIRLPGATIVAADSIGRTYETASEPDGTYTLSLPSGTYAPWATLAGMEDAPLMAGPLQRRIWLRDGERAVADFVLTRPALRAPVASAPQFPGEPVMVHTAVLTPADVRRREFAFTRAGFTVRGSQLYEPPSAGPYPALIIIIPCASYPCSVLAYDLMSATLAAQGYAVVAYSPQRGVNIEGDVDDLLALLVLARSGALSPMTNGRVGLMTGSLTAIHLWRAAELAPKETLQAIIVLGGPSDLFLIRRRFEEGVWTLEPPFQETLTAALLGLGRPNENPESYVRYSPVYHLDGLPKTAIALVHGGKDKIVPIEQTTRFDAALSARGIPHETMLFPNHEHYLDLDNISPDELDMLDRVLGFLGPAMHSR